MNVANAEQAIWIDTDPACGHQKIDDVDDCWALLLALRSDDFDIRGISTVFGNGSGEKSYQTAIKLKQRFSDNDIAPKIHRGADEQIDLHEPIANNASRAMASALTKEPLTLIALGPLTNIAILILNHPDKLSNIKQVIAVAGQRPEPGLGFYPGRSKLLHFHDLNFRKDSAAFEIVMNSDVPITLVPYEIASKITINQDDLTQLKSGGAPSQWLAKISEPWLDFWVSSLQAEGFYPFDSLAVALLIMPDVFTCENIPVKIEHKRSLFVPSRDKLLVSHDFSGKRQVKYCHDIKQTFKYKLIERLK